MNPLEALKQAIAHALPEAELKLHRPRKADGNWWLDAEREGHEVTIQWKPNRGFGISSIDETLTGYGEGPEEVFANQEAASLRVIFLLKHKVATQPPGEVLLKELRALIGVTQEQLAGRLGVQQAAVSRLERRTDVTLGSLRRYAAALGGQLEINMRTATGEQVKILSPTYRSAERATATVESPASRATASRSQKAKAVATTTAVNLLVLYVSDLEKSKKFYSLLGLHFVSEKHERGPAHYSASIGDLILELYPCPKSTPASRTRLGFRFTAATQLRERLQTEGWKRLRELAESTVYLAKDPDDNAVEIELAH